MPDYLEKTRNWVEKFVIGLNLCPFAKRPFSQGRIRFVLEETDNKELLAQTFVKECLHLVKTPSSELETTLLIHPNILRSFEDYLAFIEVLETIMVELDLEGVLQVASFHPDYQFAGTKEQDPENFTNRSPFPMLHLIREDSISAALEQYENPEVIPEVNIAKMNQLGAEGIRKLLDGL